MIAGVSCFLECFFFVCLGDGCYIDNAVLVNLNR
jgi:hypothetical protein